MSLRLKSEGQFPKDWSQLYALGYGELCALIESFFDDTISADEFRQLYRRQSDIQYERVSALVAIISEEMGLRTKRARSE